MLKNQYSYAYQWAKEASQNLEFLNSYRNVEPVTTYDKQVDIVLNENISFNQEVELLTSSIITLNNRQPSTEPTKGISEKQKTKKVFIDGEIPKEIKRKNYDKLINEINQNFASDWQKIKELEYKDIDIRLSFERDPESSNIEAIYTIYVMDLNMNDIEIIWSRLRKLLDQNIDRMKHNQPRYRRKIEKFEQIAVIHIEW